MAHLKHREIDELYARITPDEEERSQRIAEQQRRNFLLVDIVTKVIITGIWVALFIYGTTLLEN
jgi:hypothetical protein